VTTLGIEHITYSSWWDNFPPMMTASEMQQAFSREHGINMLAANTGAKLHNRGFGIYSSGIALETEFNTSPEPQSKMLISSVPRHPKKLHPTNPAEAVTQQLKASSPKDSPKYNISVFPAITGSRGSKVLTAGDLACSYSWDIRSGRAEVELYWLFAYNGFFPLLNITTQICGLLRCANKTSCQMTNIGAKTVFESFSVAGTFSPAATPYALLGANQGQLIDSSQVVISGPSMRSTPMFNSTLLDAVFWAIELQATP